MWKRASIELSLYTVASILMGAFLFVFFINIGYRFGHHEERHQEYIIKDGSLLLNALHTISGNAIVEMHYLVYNRFIRHNKTHFSVYDPDVEQISTFYRFRYAGENKSKDYILQNPDYLEATKFSKEVSLNNEGNLDMLNCVSHPNNYFNIRNIQFLYLEDDVDFSLSLINSITSRIFHTDGDRQRMTGRFDSSIDLGVDLSVVFTHGNSNNFYAFVPHSNKLAREIACNFLNELMKVNRLEVNRINVFSIEPDFQDVKGKKIFDNMIFFELGSLDNGVDENIQTIANRFVDVLMTYEE